MEFKKYPKIRALGHKEVEEIFSNPTDKIIIQEKIDGANFRFYIKDGNIIFGSRTQQITSNVGEETNVNKNFIRCLKHIQNSYKKHKNMFGNKFIYYGECCVKHTMNYDWEKIPPFLGFDIYCTEKEEFITVDPKHWEHDLGLAHVPIIKETYSKDIKEIDESDIPISKYACKINKDKVAEGIVIKNYSKQLFAKFVRAKFKEDNAETFGGTVKYQEDDSGKIVARFCTNARIDKIIFKLIDENFKLEMKMMEELPNRVTKDIWDEHWEEIINKYQLIEPRKIKKNITRRCLAVLKQVITNNQLQEEDN